MVEDCPMFGAVVVICLPSSDTLKELFVIPGDITLLTVVSLLMLSTDITVDMLEYDASIVDNMAFSDVIFADIVSVFIKTVDD